MLFGLIGGTRYEGRVSGATSNTYETGTKISNAQIASLNITPDAFHGEWNDTIAPQPESE